MNQLQRMNKLMMMQPKRMALPTIFRAQHRSIFYPTTPLLATKTIKVPTMGDSITEGTIVEWVVSIGQAVKADDVIALIETDKVTVDIKAEMDGVITQRFGAVDETVAVGAKLYDIDTDAPASEIANSEIPATPKTTPSKEPTAVVTTEKDVSMHGVASISHGRIPSIHFLGKEGWALQLSPALVTVAVAVANAATTVPVKPNAAVTLDGSFLTPLYGRPLFSEKEMDALILGGANVAPSVKSFSSGSTFGL